VNSRVQTCLRLNWTVSGCRRHSAMLNMPLPALPLHAHFLPFLARRARTLWTRTAHAHVPAFSLRTAVCPCAKHTCCLCLPGTLLTAAPPAPPYHATARTTVPYYRTVALPTPTPTLLLWFATYCLRLPFVRVLRTLPHARAPCSAAAHAGHFFLLARLLHGTPDMPLPATPLLHCLAIHTACPSYLLLPFTTRTTRTHTTPATRRRAHRTPHAAYLPRGLTLAYPP